MTSDLLNDTIHDQPYVEMLAVLRTLSDAERRAVHGAFVPNLQSKESLLLDRMLAGEMPLVPGGGLDPFQSR
ncbi:MAG: hypothetical protein JNK49_09965 [Planctomycetes bacterium]|nr:hypothetical protein [Planctomycetota bacterium]